MSLKNLLGKMEKTLTFEDEKVTIKPLSLKHLGELLESNKDDLKSLFNASKGLKEVIAEMPGLAYKVIHMASGEKVEEIALLPIGIQLQLLEAVVDTSQISSDAMGKLISRLVRGVQATMIPQKNSTSKDGSKMSKKQLASSLEKATAS